ncbi:MAG: thioredoxin family protein [Geothrix sp.]|jgi:small redox-active disulfide protein 2|uniref:Thioredoxin family protein n=1 Tax=Candidatus Geothrix odensensis TaxID=2954440 RepID=A0A936F3D2_9BACT|nr:thioredoxin family protein [Holophagaceae bacterium]MBK8573158.1 thioredoxin family protein [Candidatus Geothrix odensensis]MCC6512683.1 thioredoxin family protein [Geothrix sp.]
MRIEILGTGCAKCKLLAERAEEAARGIGADYTLVKVTEYPDIVARGVMTTPGLVVDGVVKSQGHVPTVAAIQELLR